jgi:hypothetical protein
MNHICRELAKIPESSRALPLLLMFSALLMGAIFIVRMNADLNYDGQIYIAAAMKFDRGMYREGLAIYRMPAYPFLVSLVHIIIPNWVMAGRLISLFSMTLTVIPLYLIAKDLFNSRAAFWSCIAFILLPETLRHSNSVLRDPAYFLFFMSAVYFVQKALQSKKPKHFFGSVLFAMGSTLFRIEGLIFFPVCFCVFVGLAFIKAKERKQYIWITFAWGITLIFLLFGISLASSSSAYEFFNRYSDWAAYYQNFRELSFLENYNRIANQLQQIYDTSALRDIGHHVAKTASALMPFIFFVGLLQILLAVLLTSNVAPLIWGLSQTNFNERHVLQLLLIGGLLVLAYGSFIRTEIILKRYLLMPGILLTPWIGFGIDRILKYVQKFSASKLIAGCIVLAFFVIPATGFDHLLKTHDDLAAQAGDYIATHDQLRRMKIVFNDQIVKFYTDMQSENQSGPNTLLHLMPSDKDFSKLLRYAQDNNADVIVIQDHSDGSDAANKFSGYKEIKEFIYKKKFIRIYVLE